jgi:hypothetical protein
MRRVFILILVMMVSCEIASAQDYSADTIRLSGSYLRTDIPFRMGQYMGRGSGVENRNGFAGEADVKVFGRGKFRASLAYNFKQLNDVTVYPNYNDGMNIVDLYRNVRTHSGCAQAGYAIGGVFEPFGALCYGRRKIHTDTPYQTVRTFRVGANLLLGKHLFAKGYVDREQSYGALPMGFVGPNTQTIGFGGGFRF